MTTNTAPEAIANYDEIARAMESRAATYGLLARLYRREVDQPLLDELKTAHFPLNTGNGQVDSGYRLMVGYLSKTWENTLTELAADYLRTFLGHGIDGHSAAYPYESVYTSERRLLMQDARTEILALFRANGLEKDPSFKDAEDHIALELEFMQLLALRCAEALRAGNSDDALALVRSQATFLDEHLMAWAPLLTTEMLKFAKTDFYRGLSRITEGFLAEDQAMLEEMAASAEE
ncbi:TorD/DmsD family molecular chaperone [Parvibacter caecicola]|uniref:TorD/DmsD family molecular chaperone n=1 Tax=Parvibacter caecicola TaxID=747645 RepID=UPI0027311C6F|nr:molecular chaperone TorD family protein [Parvibacter caecicola]